MFEKNLHSVLQEFNPWWTGRPVGDLPRWERSHAAMIWDWVSDKDTARALLLSGARQVGKTTLYRQTIRRLLSTGVVASNVLFATLDHPLLKLAGLNAVLNAWKELYLPDPAQPRMLFLDEIQHISDWQTWLKHQIDFHREFRIAVTGSATPLHDASAESGVGRWETITLPTLSFAEFLQLREINIPNLPTGKRLDELFEWSPVDFAQTAAPARDLSVHFHDYLMRGGFPEPALVDDLVRCQRLLREDIVDKVLKRDMTALYGVRRVLDLEKILLYLCYHDGGILDTGMLSRELEDINKQAVTRYLDLFEAAHLVYRLKPYGYGKEVLRGRDKVYLADAALPGAMLLLGRKLLEQRERLGAAVENTVFRHVFTRNQRETPRLSYWRDRKGKGLEVDLIAEVGDQTLPFEVKYQDAEITPQRLQGLQLFLERYGLDRGYCITRRWSDFGVMHLRPERSGKSTARALLLPAPLACYWMS